MASVNLKTVFETARENGMELVIRSDVLNGGYFVHLYKVYERKPSESVYSSNTDDLTKDLNKVIKILKIK